MKHEHLDAETLERLLALDRTEDQNRSLLHQIAICRSCRKVGGWLLDLHRSGALPSRFAFVDAALARSRAEAPALWARLQRHSQKKRLALVRAEPSRFASWGLGELLSRESAKIAPEDAGRAVELADLAVFVADAVEDYQPAEPYWVYQLRALAWGFLGNARRVAGDLEGAEQAFLESDTWWEAGVETIGDALGYEPVLLDLKASLRTTQRRFEEALRMLDQAGDIYLHGDPEHRDPHLAGRSLVKKAYALIEMGETEKAVTALRQAEPLVDANRSPRLHLCLRHNLVDNLTKAGGFSEAVPLLPEVQALSEAHGSQLDRIRLRWVEARVAAGTGDGEGARRILGEVLRGFLERGIVYDAALASLELATLWIEEGRTVEVRTLAAEMVAVFRAQKVAREALAALLTFEAAAARETATVSLVREISARLERARRGSSDFGLWE